MDVNKLSNQMIYGKILNLYKDENGKIDWFGVFCHPNLPLSFVDKFFHQLHPFGIESTFQLDDKFIIKWSEYLNWYKLLKTQNLSMEILEKFAYKFNQNPSYWILILKYQKLTYEFLIKIKDMFKNQEYKNDIFIDSLKMNAQIEPRIINSFLSIL